MGVSTSPDKLTSEALGKDITQYTIELVARAMGEDEKTQKLDRFMNEGDVNARVRIYYEAHKARRPVTAMALIRRLKMPRRTVYEALRRLTEEGWLDEAVGPSYSSWKT